MKARLVSLSILLFTNLSFCQTSQWLNLTTTGFVTTPVEDDDNLWFPTSGGLVCYNRLTGQRTIYNGSNSPLVNNSIADIAIDKFKKIWISTTHHGLFTLHNNVWNDCRYMISGDTITGSGQIQTDSLLNVFIAVSLASDSAMKIIKNDGTSITIIDLPAPIRQFDIDNSGNIWAGANWNTIYKYNGLNWVSFDSTNSILPAGWGWIQGLGCDQNNNVYASVLYVPNQSVNYKSVKFDGTAWVDFPVAGFKDFRGIYSDRNNSTWFFAGIPGAVQYDGVSSFTYYSTNDPFWPSNNLTSLYVDSLNHLWVGCTSCGPYAYEIFNNNQTPHNLSGSDIPSNAIHDLVIDNDNNKWVSIPNALAMYNGIKWSIFTTSNSGLNSNSINKLYKDSLGHIWTISADNNSQTAPLAQFDGTNWTTFWLDTVSGSSNIRAVDCALDAFGNLWVATQSGLIKFDGSSYTTYTKQNSGLIDDYIFCLSVDYNNIVWIGTYYGVSAFDGVNWISYTTANSGIAENIVFDIHTDKSNNKWFLTSYLSKFDGNSWTTFPASQAGSSNFSMGIISDNQNRLIVGTESGFSIYDGSAWTNYNGYNSGMTGIANSFAFDRGNNLWIGTTVNGIVIYNPERIDFESYSNLPQYTLSGNVFFDQNNNAIKDGGESGLGFQKLIIKPDSSISYTGSTGNYIAFANKGTYDLSLDVPSNWMQSSLPLAYNLTVDSTDIGGINFGLFPLLPQAESKITLTSGGNRCFNEVPYWIDYSNCGTTVLNGIIEYEKSDSLFFINAIPQPDTVNGNILKWHYNNLMPFESRQIKITMQNPLDTLIVTSTAYLFSGSQIINSATLMETIRCSYDPNDKIVSPQGYGADNRISPSDTLTYTIRFQNTGNDTAFSVLIVDSISEHLDFENMEIVASSHNCIPLLQSRIARFYFPDINLLWESANEPESHGFIKYRIPLKATLPDSTQIFNKAYIYFDFNLPIETNQTLNTIHFPITGVSEEQAGDVIVYPVPCDRVLNIKLSAQTEPVKIMISELSGKILWEEKFTSRQMQIGTGRLKNGIYIVSIKGYHVDYRKKFIVIH